jgi:hypothetical protein
MNCQKDKDVAKSDQNQKFAKIRRKNSLVSRKRSVEKRQTLVEKRSKLINQNLENHIMQKFKVQVIKNYCRLEQV